MINLAKVFWGIDTLSIRVFEEKLMTHANLHMIVEQDRNNFSVRRAALSREKFVYDFKRSNLIYYQSYFLFLLL